MKRLIAAALMLCTAGSAGAQVDYKFVNFQNTGGGFTAELWFRNVNQYGDAGIIAIDPAFQVGVGQRVQDDCTPAGFCFMSGSSSKTSGAVQTGQFLVNGNTWANSTIYGSEGSGANQHFENSWSAMGSYVGVIGCQVPARNFVATYVARTCDADGFTGWLSVDVNFRGVDGTTYSENDLYATFTTTELQGPNAINVVPEPTTWALMLSGLSPLGLVRRRRNHSTS